MGEKTMKYNLKKIKRYRETTKHRKYHKWIDHMVRRAMNGAGTEERPHRAHRSRAKIIAPTL
jgi:hypothetical protein